MSIAFFTDDRDETRKVHVRAPAVLAAWALALMAASIIVPLGISFIAGGLASMIVLTVYILPALPVVTAVSVIVVAGMIGTLAVQAWQAREPGAAVMETTRLH